MIKPKRPSAKIRLGEETTQESALSAMPVQQDVASCARLAKEVIQQRAALKQAERRAKEASQLGVHESTVSALREMLQQLEVAGFGDSVVKLGTAGYPKLRAGEGRLTQETRHQLRGVYLKDADSDADAEGNLLPDTPVVELSNSFPAHLRPDLKKKLLIEDDEDFDEDEDEDEE